MPPAEGSSGVHALEVTLRYLLLWLIGIPIPVLILIYFLFH